MRHGETNEEQRRALARSLLRAGPEGEPASDMAFLAGFRNKLARAREPRKAGASLGELCWRLIPAFGAAAALLIGTSLLVLQRQPSLSSWGDHVAWSFFAEGPSQDIGDDLILSAALLEGER